MLFNKYQYYNNDIREEGSFTITKAFTETEPPGEYLIKWVSLNRNSDFEIQMLGDRVKQLQKARHEGALVIEEFGLDEERKEFAVVYQFPNDLTNLEERAEYITQEQVISGFIDLAESLQHLHLNYKIVHAGLTPSCIYINSSGNFLMADFGLAGLVKKRHYDLLTEAFQLNFCAPEKINLAIKPGFPFQSDVYSLGKLMEWFLSISTVTSREDMFGPFRQMIDEVPAQRPRWSEVISLLKNFFASRESDKVYVILERNFRSEAGNILRLLNTSAKFETTGFKYGNYSVDILLAEKILCRSSWSEIERTLFITDCFLLSKIDGKAQRLKLKYNKELKPRYNFTDEYSEDRIDLTSQFQKQLEEKEVHKSLKETRKEMWAELDFFSALLKKERELISERAIRLQYRDYKIQGGEIWFYLIGKEKGTFPDASIVNKHIEDGNAPESEPIEYFLSSNSDIRQTKGAMEFVGKPFNYSSLERILKIKDFDRLQLDKIPHSGYLYENTKSKEEEKKRQQEAISKARNNDVPNPGLIYYLFRPDELPPNESHFSPLENVKQVGKNKDPLKYSYNQHKAIQNAISKRPLSVIQGPPGTGKTTVITEIVFQILQNEPLAKILITSQTNNAVDQVLENLLKNEVPLIRLSGKSKPQIKEVGKNTIDKKLETWKQQVEKRAIENLANLKQEFARNLNLKDPFIKAIVELLIDTKLDWNQARQKIEIIAGKVPTLKDLQLLPNQKEKAITLIDKVTGAQVGKYIQHKNLHSEWIATVHSLDEKSQINDKLVSSIRVLGATCNHSASKTYRKYNFEFDYVIMDESGKATTSEALVPITMAKNLIFVGDHRQLRPNLTQDREVRRWLSEQYKNDDKLEFETEEEYINRPSLFEQVIIRIDDSYKAQLTECRRSTEEQVKLTSRWFYEAEHDLPIKYESRNKSEEHNLPLGKNASDSIFFIDIGSDYQNEEDGEKNRSSINKVSAKLIPEILEKLNDYPKIKSYSIGLITGYKGQRRELERYVNKKKREKKLDNIFGQRNQPDKFILSVIDKFQGLERDIIILDLVKSGPGLNLGFLEVPNRINVALSRQKRLLIIVGDYYGIINAKIRFSKDKEAALQGYLKDIRPECIFKVEQFNELFQ